MNKKGFSMIEVLVSTFILSIAVFGVYKLIAENTKSVEKSNMILTTTNLFSVLENCIEYSNGSGGYLDLGNNLKKCDFHDDDFLNNIDGIDYRIGAKIKPISSDKIIFWETEVYSEFLGMKTGTYVQKKQ